MNDADDEETQRLDERLHAARRLLREAYDRRDALTVAIETAARDGLVSARPRLLVALSAAARAVIAAEADLKDAEYALAVARDPPTRAASVEPASPIAPV